MNRPIQEIFDDVIRRGVYCPWSLNRYMCHALVAAKDLGAVTESEVEYAKKEIREYLDLLPLYTDTLHGLLTSLCIQRPTTEELGWMKMYVYKHWDKRPQTTEEAEALLDRVRGFLLEDDHD